MVPLEIRASCIDTLIRNCGIMAIRGSELPFGSKSSASQSTCDQMHSVFPGLLVSGKMYRALI